MHLVPAKRLQAHGRPFPAPHVMPQGLYSAMGRLPALQPSHPLLQALDNLEPGAFELKAGAKLVLLHQECAEKQASGTAITTALSFKQPAWILSTMFQIGARASALDSQSVARACITTSARTPAINFARTVVLPRRPGPSKIVVPQMKRISTKQEA